MEIIDYSKYMIYCAQGYLSINDFNSFSNESILLWIRLKEMIPDLILEDPSKGVGSFR